MDQSVHTSELPVKIVTGPKDSEVWAKSLPPDESDEPPFFMDISFIDGGTVYHFERWHAKRFEDGFTFQNVGNKFWAYAKDGVVFTSNEFDASHCKWHLERTRRDANYNIKVPNQDLIWTMKHPDPDQRYPSLFLAPADGNPNQDFYFETVLEDD